MMKEDKLLRVEDLAELLAIKPGTIYKWVTHRKVPYVKLGSQVRFPLGRIREFLEDKTIEPAPKKKARKSKNPHSEKKRDMDALLSFAVSSCGVRDRNKEVRSK